MFNGVIVIAQDEAGGLLANYDATARAAKRKMIDDCKKQGSKCKIIKTIKSEPWLYYKD